jgi:hypothetical protein
MMARIPGVSPQEAGPEIAGTLRYAREMMAQLVELTHAIVLENLYGRFNHVLGIGSAGFSEGMV